MPHAYEKMRIQVSKAFTLFSAQFGIPDHERHPTRLPATVGSGMVRFWYLTTGPVHTGEGCLNLMSHPAPPPEECFWGVRGPSVLTTNRNAPSFAILFHGTVLSHPSWQAGFFLFDIKPAKEKLDSCMEIWIAEKQGTLHFFPIKWLCSIVLDLGERENLHRQVSFMLGAVWNAVRLEAGGESTGLNCQVSITMATTRFVIFLWVAKKKGPWKSLFEQNFNGSSPL